MGITTVLTKPEVIDQELRTIDSSLAINKFSNLEILVTRTDSITNGIVHDRPHIGLDVIQQIR